jgi:hypothetical protein
MKRARYKKCEIDRHAHPRTPTLFSYVLQIKDLAEVTYA